MPASSAATARSKAALALSRRMVQTFAREHMTLPAFWRLSPGAFTGPPDQAVIINAGSGDLHRHLWPE
jgi:hypothetical protein